MNNLNTLKEINKYIKDNCTAYRPPPEFKTFKKLANYSLNNAACLVFLPIKDAEYIISNVLKCADISNEHQERLDEYLNKEYTWGGKIVFADSSFNRFLLVKKDNELKWYNLDEINFMDE